MAITRKEHQSGGSNDPIPIEGFKTRIMNNQTKDIIIVDLVSDVNDPETEFMLAATRYYSVRRGTPNMNLQVLSGLPYNAPTLRETFDRWDYRACIVLGDEVCVLEYDTDVAADKNGATRLSDFIGFLLGTDADVIYLAIDPSAQNNHLKVYYG